MEMSIAVLSKVDEFFNLFVFSTDLYNFYLLSYQTYSLFNYYLVPDFFLHKSIEGCTVYNSNKNEEGGGELYCSKYKVNSSMTDGSFFKIL